MTTILWYSINTFCVKDIINSYSLALSKFGMGSRFGNSPPYKPTLPDPQFPPLYGTQEGNNDNAYYDRFDAQGDEYNSGNMRPSVENQYQQPNIQQGSYQNQFDQPASDDFQLEQNQYEEPVYPDTQCRIPNRHLNSIPSGSVKNIHITRLVTKSAVKCLQKCCDLGPKDCQYIWVFKSKCFAVACQKAFASLCRPRKVFDKNAKDTSYYEVAHPEQHNIEIDNGAGKFLLIFCLTSLHSFLWLRVFCDVHEGVCVGCNFQ